MTKKRTPKPRRPSFKVGDVVCLPIHGGPMTVEACEGEQVWCVWFGIDRLSRWTGPYRKRFRCDEIELTTQPPAPHVVRLEKALVAAYTEVEVLKADRDRLSALQRKSA